MKFHSNRSLWICGVLVALLTSPLARASQLVTLLGSPDRSQAFVRRMLQREIPLNGSAYEADWTTRLYSIFSENGVTSAISVAIVSPDGVTSNELIQKGIDTAAPLGPVVMTAVGGGVDANKLICAAMARHPETAFVLAAGKSGYEIGEGTEAECMARNILRVAALDQSLRQLMPTSNFGATIRVAAPGENIDSIGAGGKPGKFNGTSPASAIAAAGLAAFASNTAHGKGADLIRNFLAERTEKLPGLEGKVEDGRALIGAPGEPGI